MEQNQKPEPVVTEPVASETEVTTATETQPAAAPAGKNSKKTRNIVVALVIVAMLLVGVFYVMEKQGRVDTNFFGGISSAFQANVAVAIVNDSKITQQQLDISVTQLNQTATLQGIDPTSPSAQAEIREQAIDVLINTELLVQAAKERGITVSDEELGDRIAQIETEIGGLDVLEERMEELGITYETLRADVTSEIHIERLLDALFLEADITVSDDEVNEIYDAAAASGVEVPPLADVRDQIEQQIVASKEQEVIDQYLETIKAEATIEIVE